MSDMASTDERPAQEQRKGGEPAGGNSSNGTQTDSTAVAKVTK
jgi:hypothetical protein